MASIELKDDQLTTVVAQSILTALSPEQREKMITEAIINLLNRPRDGSVYGVSHLQTVFNNAVQRVAEKLLETELTADGEFAKRVRSVTAEAMERVFAADQREKMVDRMAGAIRTSFYGTNY